MSRQPTKFQSARFTQTRTAFALKIATIIAATVTIFYGDLALIFNLASQNATAIYIIIVPFAVAYLIYRKRKMLRAVMPLSANHQTRKTPNLASLTGILLAATAILLYWQGSYAFTPLEPHNYVFTPIASHILALPIFTVGLTLLLFNFQTLRQLALPIAFLFFLVPPPSEIPAYALPVGFTLIFTITTILLLTSDKAFRSHVLHKTPIKCNQCSVEPPPNRDYCRTCGRILYPGAAKLHKADTVKIATIILVAVLLVIIQSPAFAINKRTPIIAIDAPSGRQYSTQILPEIQQYSLTYDPLGGSQTKEDLLAICYKYTQLTNETDEVHVALEISSSTTPPAFKPSAGTPVTQLNHTFLPSIGADCCVYQYPRVDLVEVVVYWYTSPIFIINQTAQQKLVETVLIAYPHTMNDVPAVEQRLAFMATQITNYWMPTETWLQATARFLSHNGIILSTVTSIAIIASISYYATETRRRRKENLAAVSKLNSLSTEIVMTLQKTRKPITMEKLAAALHENTGQAMTLEQLETRLRELENAGILKKQISGQDDTPIQTWKL